MENVVFNIGCTITRTVVFYKGSVKISLKWTFMMFISIQRWHGYLLCRMFYQECVALTIKGKTHFITWDMSDSYFFDIVIDFENNIINNNKGE